MLVHHGGQGVLLAGAGPDSRSPLHILYRPRSSPRQGRLEESHINSSVKYRKDNNKGRAPITATVLLVRRSCERSKTKLIWMRSPTALFIPVMFQNIIEINRRPSPYLKFYGVR